MRKPVSEWSVFAALAILLVGSVRAEAAAMLRLSDGVSFVTIVDGDPALDAASLTPGVILFLGSVGVFTLNVSTGIAEPANILPEIMHLHSFNSSSAAGTLTIEFTITDVDINTLGSQMSPGPPATPTQSTPYSAYYDTTNPPFGQASLIGTLGPFDGTDRGTTGGEGPGDSTFYSLTQKLKITHAGAGSSGFNARLSIPEPASMVLFGIALLGFGLVSRRHWLGRAGR